MLIREELRREAAAGFATLARIPSAGVIKLLDCLAELGADEQSALFDAQARLAALAFFPAPLIAKAHDQLRTTEPALVRQQEALRAPGFGYGLRYTGLRMARMMLNDPEIAGLMAQTRAGLDFVPRDDLPEALVGGQSIDEIATAKAPLLRKLLDPMLRHRLGAKPVKRPGGELSYEGALGGTPVRVSIIFSNLDAQLAYGVSWSRPDHQIRVQRLSYEALFGMNTGWDYLTEDNAAPAIDLLDALLVRLAGLFERIAAVP